MDQVITYSFVDPSGQWEFKITIGYCSDIHLLIKIIIDPDQQLEESSMWNP